MNKHVALPLLAFAAFSAFAAARAPEEEIAFRPSEGLRLVFTLDSKVELDLVEASMVVTEDGEESEMEGMEVDGTLSHTEKVVFTDEVLAATEGRITKLRRTYDEISQTVEQSADDGGSGEQSGASELEGTTVVFTWDADAEAYTAAFEDGDGDSDLLEDLEGRVDLTEFLPEGPVAKNDTWSVDAKAFNMLASPGGDLHVLMEDEEPDEEGDISDQLDENLEGEISCQLTDVREEDGVRIAVIAVTAKLESRGSEEDSQEIEEIGTIAIRRELSIAFELEGELLWNLTVGRAVEFSLAGELHYESQEEQELEAISASMRQAQVLEGPFTLAIRIE